MVSAPLGWDHIWEDTLPHSEVYSPPSSTLHVSSQFAICSPGQWIPKTIWCLTNFYFTCLPTGTMFNQLCFNPTCRYRPFWPFIITRGICPHCFLRRGGVPKKEWEPILTSEKGFQVLQTHLDLLHQEVSCSVLDILQPFQLTLLSDKIVLLNEFSIQALFLRLFCHLCRLGQCQSEFHNPVRRGEERRGSTQLWVT